MSVKVSFRLSFRVKRQVEDVAKNQGKSPSDIYREAVTDWVSYYTNEPSMKGVYLKLEGLEKMICQMWRDLEGQGMKLTNLERKS